MKVYKGHPIDEIAKYEKWVYVFIKIFKKKEIGPFDHTFHTHVTQAYLRGVT
jgi:hypothetical protein